MMKASDLTIQATRRAFRLWNDGRGSLADIHEIDERSGEETKMLHVYRVEIDCTRGEMEAMVTYKPHAAAEMRTEVIRLDEFDLRFAGVEGQRIGPPDRWRNPDLYGDCRDSSGEKVS